MLEASLDRLREVYALMKKELKRVIVGQDEVVDQLLMAVLTRGHCLLVGVPGLAKTLMISSLARTMDLSFSRIQFTPDLMPSDITGTELLHIDPETAERSFRFAEGPLFANVLLADEINRTPPKTQAALLEAMQEHRVTVQGRTYVLSEPFHVFATQNPIELEGTYPLPEAQLDRFMFHILIDHPPEEEELEVVRRTTSLEENTLEHAVDGPALIAYQRLVRQVPVSDHVASTLTATGTSGWHSAAAAILLALTDAVARRPGGRGRNARKAGRFGGAPARALRACRTERTPPTPISTTTSGSTNLPCSSFNPSPAANRAHRPLVSTPIGLRIENWWRADRLPTFVTVSNARYPHFRPTSWRHSASVQAQLTPAETFNAWPSRRKQIRNGSR